EALALAGILALAGVGRALARALALAGVGAVALHAAICVRRRGEGAGSEDRSSGGDQCTLGHEQPPDRASIRLASGIRGDYEGRYAPDACNVRALGHEYVKDPLRW